MYQYNRILDELDTIRRQQRKAATKKRKHIPSLKRRIDLGRYSDAPPCYAVYPFMLDDGWYHMYKAANPEAQLAVFEKDPLGFGLGNSLQL